MNLIRADTPLEELHLAGNAYGNIDGILRAAVRANTRLKVLDLSNSQTANMLYDSHLKVLKLSRISNVDAEMIRSFQKHHLTDLDLSFNLLSLEAVNAFADFLEDNTVLRSLNLEGCQLSDCLS